jgi:hypothetical protein
MSFYDNCKAHSDLKKVIKVVKSCTTVAHCDTGRAYLSQFNKHHNVNRKTHPFMILMVAALFEYLSDTSEHAERGYHKPRWCEWKTIRTYPDINKYLGPLVDHEIRF